MGWFCLQRSVEIGSRFTGAVIEVDRCIAWHPQDISTTEDATIANLQMTDVRGTVADRYLKFFGGGSVEVIKLIIGRETPQFPPHQQIR